MDKSPVARISLVALAFATLLPFSARGDEWPQWRGPRRDGVSREKDWLTGWPAGSEPRIVWRAAVGRGHAAISISEGRAYTAGWDGERDTVCAFDAAAGRALWRQSYLSRTIV